MRWPSCSTVDKTLGKVKLAEESYLRKTYCIVEYIKRKQFMDNSMAALKPAMHLQTAFLCHLPFASLLCHLFNLSHSLTIIFFSFLIILIILIVIYNASSSNIFSKSSKTSTPFFFTTSFPLPYPTYAYPPLHSRYCHLI